MLPFLPLYKADATKREIWARAALEEPDKSNEVMDYATARPQFETWSDTFKTATLGKSLGNIRAMHNPKHLAGKVSEIVFDDVGKTVDVCIKVLDPVDWLKVEEGGYTGLSIGGGYLKKWACPLHKGAIRYTPRIAEISLVDSPCMPGARILELQKADGSHEEVLLKGVPRSFRELLPPPTFGTLHKGWQAPVRAFGRKVVEAASEHVAEGTPRTFSQIEHVEHAGAGSYTSRGKTFHDVASADHPATGASVTNRGKTIHHDPATGQVHSYTNTPRGKRFSISTDNELERSAPGGPLRKVQIGAAVRAGVRGVKAGWEHATPYIRAAKTTKDVIGLGLGATGAVSGGAALLHSRRRKVDDGSGPRIMPLLGKAATAAEREKIATTLHEFKHGKLRSYRGVNDKGNPRRGPKVTDRRQAVAIALSQARRVGKADGPVDLSKIGFHPLTSVKEGLVANTTGSGNLKYGFIHGLFADKPKPEEAALKKPKYMKKSEDSVRAALDERMEKLLLPLAAAALGAKAGFRAGARSGLRRLARGMADGTATHAEMLGHGISHRAVGGAAAGAITGLVVGKTVENRLRKPAYMKKRADVAEMLEKRRQTFAESAGRGLQAGTVLGGLTGLIAGGPAAAATGVAGGAILGTAVGAAAHGVRSAREAIAARGKTPNVLTPKEHEQRIAAAKARWLHEGHDDHDERFDAMHAQASKAILNRSGKVAGVADARNQFWHGVADTHAAYDKVKPHMPADSKLMMVHPNGRTLHNPEGVGEDDIGPGKKLYILGHDEVDDWIKKHGKTARAVSKMLPTGLITHVDQIAARLRPVEAEAA